MSIAFLAGSVPSSAHASTLPSGTADRDNISLEGTLSARQPGRSSIEYLLHHAHEQSTLHTTGMSGPLIPHTTVDPCSTISESSDDGQDIVMTTDGRIARAPRPSYSEEQRFYIMWARIVRSKTWPEIEDGFSHHFGVGSGPRSKGGLTSVYYRVRKIWGLEEVLKTGSDSFASDRQKVEEKAGNFSTEFLYSIGYLQFPLQR